MSRSTADLTAIKNELATDPETIGYLSHVGANDVANADLMNEVRSSLQIDREAIPATEIFVQIDRDEYAALAEADRQWLNAVAQSGTVNPESGGEVREGILQIFGAMTESRTNLQAILTEDANRVEHLFKAGTLEEGGTVTPSDIANARSG